eukprot:5591262-Prorocentrum_lima.AAC.1
MSMLPPPEVESYMPFSPYGYDQRTGVYMLAGHVKCNWEETLKNAHNQAEFKGYSMDSLLCK